MVESCLPVEVLRAWQRSSSYNDEDLEVLLTFLVQEVNSQEDRKLAQFTVGSHKQERGMKDTKPLNTKKKFGGDVPTASSFHNNTSSVNSQGGKQWGVKRVKCIFCEKHNNPIDCREALGMPLNTKIDILKKNGYCTNCIQKTDHVARDCKFNPKCHICSKRHYLLMCPNLTQKTPNKDTDSENPTALAQPETVAQLSNNLGSPEVPMQTLIVTLHGTTGKAKKVRMMIDLGSARSYVRSDLADELMLTNSGEESVVHELFGARETKEITYKKVKALVSDVTNKDKCMFECSIIPDIANNVHFPQPGPWLKEFRRRGITFSDVGSVSSKVDVLLGNDVAPKVYTDNKVLLGDGPVAMETRWGWVLGGKLPPHHSNVKSQSSFLTASLMQLDKHPLSSLWDLRHNCCH